MNSRCAFCHADSHYLLDGAEVELPICFHCLNVIIENKTALLNVLSEKLPHRKAMYMI